MTDENDQIAPAATGWRGLLIAGLHGFGMMFLMTVTFYATFFGLHFAGLLDARYDPT